MIDKIQYVCACVIACDNQRSPAVSQRVLSDALLHFIENIEIIFRKLLLRILKL